jgi:hypothetical protein
VTSEQPDLEGILSSALGRPVALAEASGTDESAGATAEEYWPDMEGLDHRDTVTEWELPTGTFFDLAVVHLLTTATLERLRALYPDGRFEVRRFRPNIVVETEPDAQGFVENDWVGQTIAIGDEVRLHITGHPPYRGAAQSGKCPRLCRRGRRWNAPTRGFRRGRLTEPGARPACTSAA